MDVAHMCVPCIPSHSSLFSQHAGTAATSATAGRRHHGPHLAKVHVLVIGELAFDDLAHQIVRITLLEVKSKLMLIPSPLTF